MPEMQEGYFYAASADGVLALQDSEPCPGSTMFWFVPKNWPGKRVEMELPTELIEKIVDAKIAARDKKKGEELVKNGKPRTLPKTQGEAPDF